MSIKKFNQFIMNEEYGLPIDRTDQQFMIQEIAKNINPDFNTLFDQYNIHVTMNQNRNKTQTGKFGSQIDLHKVSDCLLQFIQLEKELIENGIINRQTPELFVDMNRIKLSFSIQK